MNILYGEENINAYAIMCTEITEENKRIQRYGGSHKIIFVLITINKFVYHLCMNNQEYVKSNIHKAITTIQNILIQGVWKNKTWKITCMNIKIDEAEEMKALKMFNMRFWQG